MNAQRFSWCVAVLVLAMSGLAAQADVMTRYELEYNSDDLSHGVSATDLINGFGVNTDGTPLDQGINESAIAPYTDGIIDLTPGQEVFSWLMKSTVDCLPLNEGQPSDGFHPLTGNGDMPDLVDGVAGPVLKSVLRDYGRASLVVRYGFSQPTDIGYIRVIGGNLLNRDGRVFHNYDVYYRQGDCGDGICPAHGDLFSGMIGFDEFVPLALDVSTGPVGVGNTGLWQGSLTEVMDRDAKVMIPGCTDLRFVFYCVDNTTSFFLDPWQGNAQESPQYQMDCPDVEGRDTDGRQKAFVGPIIKEIDVFSPEDHFDFARGDIDYDGDRDMVDFAAFQGCFEADINTNGCFRFDYTQNNAIDADDLPGFAADMTGP
ncbi:MAG: hypothetical protein JXB13_12860 [Phycisphaerae bacterium]|nr:hypothetical protein [Phycisphaerae bacterium]